MSRNLSESGIIKELAKTVCERLTRKVVADLQKMGGNSLLSGDDSGLKNTWDEICVQVQGQHSVYWDAYDDTVRALANRYMAELPQHEREAIWLQTSAGDDWSCEEVDEGL